MLKKNQRMIKTIVKENEKSKQNILRIIKLVRTKGYPLVALDAKENNLSIRIQYNSLKNNKKYKTNNR